jgi:putative flippase GtrA
MAKSHPEPAKNSTNKKPLKFAIIGVANTGLDFLMLNALVLTGSPEISANTVSTGLAMTFSFLMNKKWTFNSDSKNYAREVGLFLVFTLFGLWVIQNGVIWLLVHYMPHFGLSDLVFLNAAKLVASVFSLSWNYLTYDRFVFRKKESDHGENRH